MQLLSKTNIGSDKESPCVRFESFADLSWSIRLIPAQITAGGSLNSVDQLGTGSSLTVVTPKPFNAGELVIHRKMLRVFATPLPLLPGVWTHASIEPVSFDFDRIKPSWL